MRGQPSDERIEAEVLVDHRAPVFEEVNKKWGLAYSPAVYASLLHTANDIWDAAGVTGFDRFWDMSVETLTAAAMRLTDATAKREILERINGIIKRAMTASASGSLSFSLAFVQCAALCDALPDVFLRDAARVGERLPIFTVPKMPDPAAMEDSLESTRKKHRRRPAKVTPPVSTRKSRKTKEDEAPKPPPEPKVIAPRLREAVRETIKAELRERLRTFERLAGESGAVGRQLTRVNEIDRLDTNIEPEIEDDL
jgi:hypothetical protein